ncbi:hypothetical protein SGPA1_21342 [Streptomyces misionensis JCM 4497]
MVVRHRRRRRVQQPLAGRVVRRLRHRPRPGHHRHQLLEQRLLGVQHGEDHQLDGLLGRALLALLHRGLRLRQMRPARPPARPRRHRHGQAAEGLRDGALVRRVDHGRLQGRRAGRDQHGPDVLLDPAPHRRLTGTGRSRTLP